MPKIWVDELTASATITESLTTRCHNYHHHHNHHSNCLRLQIFFCISIQGLQLIGIGIVCTFALTSRFFSLDLRVLTGQHLVFQKRNVTMAPAFPKLEDSPMFQKQVIHADRFEFSWNLRWTNAILILLILDTSPLFVSLSWIDTVLKHLYLQSSVYQFQ